ncbi:LysR family glycine cleavage system transcriptional activator [Marinomonas alcarazii]|uniref:LysR family glycine cleavage system transcriptional activator n=1 Tax=Marinomonas alcarazii TaxID=491949 RepID=A0A318UX00_9GAMM|nr:LysR family transcriptional regulator [Marinomonas alcarazii]PYF81046.1 LysR family glycine cleavage system transcriptional activator [Marinomonas alcarazii]
MFQKLPPLNAIKAFESAARLNSFKAAANELHVTPTAISHQVKQLEESLNVRLFERKTRAVILTSEGEQLAAAANQSLQNLMLTVNQLKSAPRTLTISMTNSFASMWLVPNLASFQQEYPDIDIQIRAEESLIDIEYDRRVDMVIRYGELAHLGKNDSLSYIPLRQDSIGFFATSNYWQTQLDKASDAVWFCTRWKNAHLPNLGLEKEIERVSGTGIPNIRYFNDENLTAQAALSGQGIAVISELAAENAVQQSWLSKGTNTMATTITGLYYYLVIPRRQLANPAAICFKDWLCKKLATGSDQPAIKNLIS